VKWQSNPMSFALTLIPTETRAGGRGPSKPRPLETAERFSGLGPSPGRTMPYKADARSGISYSEALSALRETHLNFTFADAHRAKGTPSFAVVETTSTSRFRDEQYLFAFLYASAS
jgi:hypothetical protein